MKTFFWQTILVITLAILLAACGDSDNSTDDSPDNQVGRLEWERKADNIILRLDSRLNNASPVQLANAIPPCTLWGDGRLVWYNILEDKNQVLEARLNDDQIRQLLETVIFSGFYDWESDYAIPASSNPLIESITLNLYGETRTVSRYGDWPVDGYSQILKTCREISDTPVLFLPEKGWLSAYEVPWESDVGHWRWPGDATGIRLEELAGSDPLWIEGDLAAVVWEMTIETPGRIHILEEDRSYELALQVPNISRDAPPAPTE